MRGDVFKAGSHRLEVKAGLVDVLREKFMAQVRGGQDLTFAPGSLVAGAGAGSRGRIAVGAIGSVITSLGAGNVVKLEGGATGQVFVTNLSRSGGLPTVPWSGGQEGEVGPGEQKSFPVQDPGAGPAAAARAFEKAGDQLGGPAGGGGEGDGAMPIYITRPERPEQGTTGTEDPATPER
jgi:hypothetical protein